MKALLTAAGRGTRLGRLTETCPKPMLPIAGVPMIERIMGGIAKSAGITEFVLVVGYLQDVVRSHFGSGERWGWRVEYVDQGTPMGLGHAVNCAADLLRSGPFLLTYGDIMLEPKNYGRAAAAFDGTVDAVLALNAVDDPWAGAAVYVDADSRVSKIVEKPPRGTSTTQWNNAGLFVFQSWVFDYLAKLEPSARGEYELPDAISAMIADGRHVRGVPVEGAWRDVGTPDDYQAINAEFTLTPDPSPGAARASLGRGEVS